VEAIAATQTAPVFVSDAMPEDIRIAIGELSKCGDAGVRVRSALEEALATGTLTISAFDNYTEPSCASALEDSVQASWSAADVVVVKGDANYRRLHGDRHWSHDAAWAEVLPTPPGACTIAALRTNKSETIVGVSASCVAKAKAFDTAWSTSGKCGVIQIVASPP
jgi:hypothetical protein